MTPKLAWTALTRQAHALHPNEMGKGHPTMCTCIRNHKFINGSGSEAHPIHRCTHAPKPHTHTPHKLSMYVSENSLSSCEKPGQADRKLIN